MLSGGGIKSWSEEERPREKMLQRGPDALTDAELLGILIATGTRTKSALDLAREVLELSHKNLSELGRLSLTELQQVHGIGEAKAITICAALEIGKRRQISDVPDRTTVRESADAAKVLIPLMRDLNHEAFYVMYLNQANRVLKTEKIADGGMTMAIVDIRIVLKTALILNANQVIMAHNHPSGSLRPSEADKQLTRRVRDAAKLMDIRLIDHLIIAGSRFLSLADEGEL